LEARQLIEPHVAGLAANHASASDVRRLRGHISEEAAAAESGDRRRSVALSGMFQIAIAEIVDQPVLASFVKELITRSALTVALYWKRSAITCEPLAHADLIEAIAAGDSAQASKMMSEHLADIVSGLELSERKGTDRSSAELLAGVEVEVQLPIRGRKSPHP